MFIGLGQLQFQLRRPRDGYSLELRRVGVLTNGEGERLDRLGAFDLIFKEGYKNVGLLVNFGDGRQEGALFEILLERQKCFADVALRCQFNRSHHDSQFVNADPAFAGVLPALGPLV